MPGHGSPQQSFFVCLRIDVFGSASKGRGLQGGGSFHNAFRSQITTRPCSLKSQCDVSNRNATGNQGSKVNMVCCARVALKKPAAAMKRLVYLSKWPVHL